MASIYRRHRTRPIPDGAQIVTGKGGKVAKWTDGRGRTQRAPLSDDGAGIVIEAETYTIGFQDHNGARRTFGGTTDKVATERLADRIESLVAHRTARSEPTGDLREWLDTRPAHFLRRLAELDLIDGDRFAVGRLLSDHVSDYERWMADIDGRSATHVEGTIHRVNRVIAAACVRHWHDLAGKIERALADLQITRGLSDKTRNAYLIAFKSFCNWMVKHGKAQSSPAVNVSAAKIDEKEHRRALEPDEAARLIAAAEADTAGPFIRRTQRGSRHFQLHGTELPGGVKYSIDGASRAILYRFALETALRADTIRRLTVGDFELSGDEPRVTVKGMKATKETQTRRIPLTTATARELARRFAGRLPTAAAFDVPLLAPVMLRADLAVARAAWIAEGADADDRAKRAASDYLAATDTDGRSIDFHALRTTCGTWLEHAGIANSVAAKITGHRSEQTLRKHYHRANDRQARAAVNALPLRMTGTDGGHAEAFTDPGEPTTASGRVEGSAEGSAHGPSGDILCHRQSQDDGDRGGDGRGDFAGEYTENRENLGDLVGAGVGGDGTETRTFDP